MPLPTADLERLRAQLEHADAEDRLSGRESWWTRARGFLSRGFREDHDAIAACLVVGPALQLRCVGGEELVRSLGRLGFRDRRLLELAYVHHATVGEIAAELGVGGSQVRPGLVRARERLRDLLSRPR